jgi:hypothetical protein
MNIAMLPLRFKCKIYLRGLDFVPTQNLSILSEHLSDPKQFQC